MQKGSLTLISLLISALLLSGCATIIGGFSSTAEASGDGMGPATLSESNTTLQNDKFEALTIGANLTASKLIIDEDLNVRGTANLTKVTVRDDSIVGGDLICDDVTFKSSVNVHGNITSSDSYFGEGIEFAGRTLQLSNGSKVVGEIISSNTQTVTLIIDHSVVKGNIGFANAASRVILRNGGELKGNLLNGKLEQE
jgi:cytoskeletal protein CcmA (bactofilin family)/uncharacterized protein YceK